MVELKNNGKVNFVLHLFWTFKEVLTGGILAQHYLAYLLAEEGHNVYIFCKPEYPHENIHTLKSEVRKEEGVDKIFWELYTYMHYNTVVIYDEITWHNPHGMPNTVRWLLYDPPSLEIQDTWGENDYYFNYGDFKHKRKNSGKLTATNFYLDLFKNKNRKDRKGFCHLFHKHTSPRANEFVAELGSVDLGSWKNLGCHQYLAEEFNKYEYFITYDQKSFFPILAALSGCKVIIMNPPNNKGEGIINSYYSHNTTPEEYREKNPLYKYGMAFGFKDLYHAVNTQHLVEGYFKKMDKENKKTIKNFVKFWENKCYGK